MTTVIKTNAVMTGAPVGNVHGYNGPNDYSVMLDFNADTYFSIMGNERKDYALNEAVIVSRNRPAEYLGLDGEYYQVGANEPRLQYLPDVGYRGLLGEPARTNLLASPVNPVTQSVTVPSGNTAGRLILSHYGSGEVSLIAPELTLEGVDGKTKVYTRAVSTAFTATLTVSGSVTKAQLELNTASGYHSTSFILGDAPRNRPLETAKLSDALVGMVDWNEATIVANYVKLPSPQLNFTDFTGSLYLEKSEEAFGGLYFSSSQTKLSGANGTDSLDYVPPNSLVNKHEVTAAIIGPWARKSVKTIAYTNLAGSISMTSLRGVASNPATGKTMSVPDVIGLLGGSGYRTSAGGDSVASILTHLVIYNRKLTDSELFKVTQQWQD